MTTLPFNWLWLATTLGGVFLVSFIFRIMMSVATFQKRQKGILLLLKEIALQKGVEQQKVKVILEEAEKTFFVDQP